MNIRIRFKNEIAINENVILKKNNKKTSTIESAKYNHFKTIWHTYGINCSRLPAALEIIGFTVYI